MPEYTHVEIFIVAGTRDAGHAVHVLRRLILDDLKDIVHRDDSHQPAFPIDYGSARRPYLLNIFDTIS